MKYITNRFLIENIIRFCQLDVGHSLKESTKLRQSNYSPLRAPATFGNDKHYTRKKCGQVTAKLKIQSKYKTGLKNLSLCYAEDYVTMYRKIILN